MDRATHVAVAGDRSRQSPPGGWHTRPRPSRMAGAGSSAEARWEASPAMPADTPIDGVANGPGGDRVHHVIARSGNPHSQLRIRPRRGQDRTRDEQSVAKPRRGRFECRPRPAGGDLRLAALLSGCRFGGLLFVVACQRGWRRGTSAATASAADWQSSGSTLAQVPAVRLATSARGCFGLP